MQARLVAGLFVGAIALLLWAIFSGPTQTPTPHKQANRAVEEENYDLLLEICDKLSIENSLDPEMELQYNSKRQDLVRKELDKLTSTLPWVWGESCDEIHIRKSLLITILPKYGFQDVTEEEISEVLEALSQA